jgi:hypothetical protein
VVLHQRIRQHRKCLMCKPEPQGCLHVADANADVPDRVDNRITTLAPTTAEPRSTI